MRIKTKAQTIQADEQGFGALSILTAFVIIAVITVLGVYMYRENYAKNEIGLTKTEQKDLNQLTVKVEDLAVRTKVNAIAVNLETYYLETGHYPSYEDITNAEWVEQNIPKIAALDLEENWGLIDKEGSAYSVSLLPSGCEECTSFTISSTNKSDGTQYIKSSKN